MIRNFCHFASPGTSQLSSCQLAEAHTACSQHLRRNTASNMLWRQESCTKLQTLLGQVRVACRAATILPASSAKS